MFWMRFMIQWLVSERAGRSIIPMAFWYLSIVGSIGLSIYAVIRNEPLFILAYTPNVFIYVRNLMLIRREQREKVAAGQAEGP
jgi:lipid-A-disaccharide synthase-like uncharacterized protein